MGEAVKYLLLLGAILLPFILSIFNSDVLGIYLIPSFLCFILLLPYATKWLIGKFDLFDPVGIFAFFGLHYFYIAPVLHNYWDWWLYKSANRHLDWPMLLFWLCLINLVGLLVFFWIVNRIPAISARRTISVWGFQSRKLFWIAVVASAVGIVAQAYIVASFGGLGNMMNAFISRGVQNPFEGMGRIIMIANLGPIAGFVAVVCLLRMGALPSSWVSIGLLLLAFLLVNVIWSGATGSRSAIIFKLAWACGVIHFLVRPVPRKLIISVLPVLIIFMFLGGIYKGLKSTEQFSQLLSGQVSISDLSTKNKKTVKFILLHDFGRAHIQSMILARLFEDEFTPVLGRTYVGAAAMFVPRAIWSNRPPNKNKEATEIQFGSGYFGNHGRSSYIFGSVGEAMVNFHVVGSPFIFALLGVLYGFSRRFLYSSHPDDVRRFILPWLTLLLFVGFVSDLNDVFTVLMFNVAPLFLILFIARKKTIVELNPDVTLVRPYQ